MRSAHMTTKGLSMGKNFATSLADELTISSLLYDFSLGHLCLFVGLLYVTLDRSFVNYLLAARSVLR
jgi:hypothetical protein